MDNSYFIGFCIILLLAFMFIIYINNYLENNDLNTEGKLLAETDTLEMTTNVENTKGL
jgi:hypothetical protein